MAKADRYLRLVASLLAVSVAAVISLAIWDAARVGDERLAEALESASRHAHTAALAFSSRLGGLEEDLRAARSDLRAQEDLRRRLGAQLSQPSSEPAFGATPGSSLFTVETSEGPIRALIPRSNFFQFLAPIEEPGSRKVLIRDPEMRAWYLPSGELVAFSELDGLPEDQDRALVKNAPPQLGLPDAPVVVGLASAQSKGLGRWKVALVRTYQPERQRLYRSWIRTLLTSLSTTGILLLFGALVLRFLRQRTELAQALELADLRSKEQRHLDREVRTAALTTFAAGVVHEVSTPLNVISGRAEQLLARSQPEASEVRGILQTISTEAERIRDIIQRFLRLAREGEPVSEQLEASALLREAARLVSHRFEGAGIRLNLNLPSMPLSLRGDGRLLIQAVANLLLNACDATGKGGQVWLEAAGDGDRVKLEVEDDGPGIPEHIRHRVTDPFFTTKPPGEGHGVGLALVREIARMHRGTLELTPRSPRGTRAAIRLPSASQLEAP